MEKIKEKALSIFNDNSTEYNKLKCIEELNELSTILTQSITKPKYVNKQDIIDEIGDVKLRIWYLENEYGKENIRKRIIDKVIKLNKHAFNRRHS